MEYTYGIHGVYMNIAIKIKVHAQHCVYFIYTILTHSGGNYSAAHTNYIDGSPHKFLVITTCQHIMFF